MKSTNKPLFKIVKFNSDVIRWKLKKSFAEFEIGLWAIFITLLIFFTGVIILNFLFYNGITFDANLTIPVILNLILVFIDFTIISITFNWEIQNKRPSIPEGELFRKRKHILLLFALIVVFFIIFIYWVPKLDTSFVIEIIYGIVIVIEIILLFIYHLLTVFIVGLTIFTFKGKDTITINYTSKFIKKEKRDRLKKTVETMDYEELTSLSVRPIEVRKRPYWELVLICDEKFFKITTGTNEFLTDYATQLQNVLNLPLV